MESQTQEQTAPAATDAAAPIKLGQKDAVFAFVTESMAGVTMEPGETVKARLAKKDDASKAVRKAVRQKLFAAIKAGTIKLSKPYDDSKLKKYCSGLINNWLKKDPRLNT